MKKPFQADKVSWSLKANGYDEDLCCKMYTLSAFLNGKLVLSTSYADTAFNYYAEVPYEQLDTTKEKMIDQMKRLKEKGEWND